MALKSTIFKAELQVSDLDRHYYQSHALTIARHPSENDARMMLRIAVFALHATAGLQFTRGISTQDEPDLWQHQAGGEIALWIELGQPDDKRLRKAAGRALQVVVYSYSGRSAAAWWEQIQGRLARFANLAVYDLPVDTVDALARLARRNMQLQATVQDGELWLGDGEQTVHLAPRRLKAVAD